MKKTLTALGCMLLAVAGYQLTQVGELVVVPQNTMSAANIPNVEIIGQRPVLPVRIYPDTGSGKTDTVYVTKHDTVKVQVTNTKRIKVSEPKYVTDTIYVPIEMLNAEDSVSVNNKIRNGDRKVFTPDELPSKSADVILFVDGEKVYSSSTVITPVQPIEIDGLREP